VFLIGNNRLEVFWKECHESLEGQLQKSWILDGDFRPIPKWQLHFHTYCNIKSLSNHLGEIWREIKTNL
jgi:hypothetical protein